jgi:hypothetical protein
MQLNILPKSALQPLAGLDGQPLDGSEMRGEERDPLPVGGLLHVDAPGPPHRCGRDRSPGADLGGLAPPVPAPAGDPSFSAPPKLEGLASFDFEAGCGPRRPHPRERPPRGRPRGPRAAGPVGDSGGRRPSRPGCDGHGARRRGCELAQTQRGAATRCGASGNPGAGNGTRTRDPELGKLVLYQLSYSRLAPETSKTSSAGASPAFSGAPASV